MNNIELGIVFNELHRHRNALIDEMNSLFSTLEREYKKKGGIKEKYGLESHMGFNIFTSISQKYYMENFHSDILNLILDFKTPEIGNPKYIEEFLKLIDKVRIDTVPIFTKIDGIVVEREIGKIDLTLHDTENAIIIENKINNAVDQPNQIARYIEKIEKRGMAVRCIVYLTLTPGKRPQLQDYSCDYKKYKKQIEEKICLLSAVEGDNKIDIVHGYLPDCLESTNDIVAKVYIDQYRKLLMHLGGKEVMKESNKKIIEEIFSEKEKIGLVMDLVEVWTERKDLLGEIIIDYIMKNDQEYSFHPFSECWKTIHKRLDDDVSIAFCIDGSFGFVYAPGKDRIPQKKISRLEKLLTGHQFDKYSTEELGSDGYWVHRKINFDGYTDILSKIKEMTFIRLQELGNIYLEP
jgi:hypothetical protein